MNLAVKLYQHVTEKPAGIPDVWPADIRELGESTELPDQSGEWLLMTADELAFYKNIYQAEYDAWSEGNLSLQKTMGGWSERLNRRSAWGAGVILEFRVYTIAKYYPPAVPVQIYTNLQLAGALQMVQGLLQIGLLKEASDVLQTITTIPLVLDDWHDATQTQTVRQYFSDKILQGM